MNLLRTKIGAVAMSLAAAGGLALLGPSAAAVADTSGYAISFQGPATLISHGIAVSQTVVISCPAGTVVDVGANIRQAVGNRIASGSGQRTIECTGSPQTLLVTMTNFSDVTFNKGRTALVGAGVSGCGPEDCGSASTSATVKIT